MVHVTLEFGSPLAAVLLDQHVVLHERERHVADAVLRHHLQRAHIRHGQGARR